MKTYKDFLLLTEGGNAFDDVSSIEADYKDELYLEIKELIEDELDFNISEYAIIGSFKNKKEEMIINDVDIAISYESFGQDKNNLKFPEDSYVIVEKLKNKIDKKIKDETRDLKTLGVVSIKKKLEFTKDTRYFQIDLIPVPTLEWGKFSYYSPGLKESDYKGLYRNALFEAIAKSIHFDVKYYSGHDTFSDTDEKEYYRYRYFRNIGLWKVKEYNEGKRVLSYKKEKESYEFISCSPEKIVKVLLGDGIKLEDCYTFEEVFSVVKSKDFIHKEVFDNIIENFRIIIEDRQKNELPEIITKYIK